MIIVPESLLFALPLLVLMLLLPLLSTALLAVIGWRFMVAHEKTARTLRQIADNLDN